jgi:hypothetical protein
MKTHSWSKRGFDYSTWHLPAKLMTMTTPIRGYSRVIDVLSILVLLASLLVAVRKNPDLRLQKIWIMIALAIVAIHWVVPERYGDLASVDTRFPPFAFLAALAIPSFGRRRNAIIFCALSVFAARMAYTSAHFFSEQKRLETLAAGIATIPEHAILVAYAPPDDGPWVKRAELHFWAYGVIDRGWVSPTLFHQKGVQPLAMRKSIYLGDDPSGGYDLSRLPDWGQIRQQYDFVWAYNVPALDRPLSAIARIGYDADKLKVFEIQKDPRARLGTGDCSDLLAVRQSDTSVFAIGGQ